MSDYYNDVIDKIRLRQKVHVEKPSIEYIHGHVIAIYNFIWVKVNYFMIMIII